MRKGRKPKPSALKILEGNPGKRKLNPKEPKPKVVAPTRPAHVQGIARREWGRIVKELKVLGLVTKIDRAALAAYCVAYGRHVEAEDQIRKHGMVDKRGTGAPMQSVYLAISNKAMEQMRQILIEFGMTPSSRSRVVVNPGDQGDAAKGFLFGDSRSA